MGSQGTWGSSPIPPQISVSFMQLIPALMPRGPPGCKACSWTPLGEIWASWKKKEKEIKKKKGKEKTTEGKGRKEKKEKRGHNETLELGLGAGQRTKYGACLVYGDPCWFLSFPSVKECGTGAPPASRWLCWPQQLLKLRPSHWSIHWSSWLRIIKTDPEVLTNPPDPSKQEEIPIRKDTQADLLRIPLSDKDKNRAY